MLSHKQTEFLIRNSIMAASAAIISTTSQYKSINLSQYFLSETLSQPHPPPLLVEPFNLVISFSIRDAAYINKSIDSSSRPPPLPLSVELLTNQPYPYGAATAPLLHRPLYM